MDLARLLDEVRGMVQPIADKAGLVVAVEAPNGAFAHADPDALRQIVLNLATNAVKYTETGSIRLSAQPDGDRVSVRVHDSGIGIAPEHLERIFDPF